MWQCVDDFTTVVSVENKPGDPLGPRPGSSPAVAGLSRSRGALLETLRAQTAPTSIAALVAHTGLHENTLRGHLEGLEDAGLVSRQRETPEGRGRPAWLWTATTGRTGSEYAGLAAALAGTVQRTSDDPAADAALAGREWGRSLVRDNPAHGQLADSRELVQSLMDQLGFVPVMEDDTVRLTRCPLLEVARRHKDVVCSVHTGLISGALEEFGDHDTEAVLQPFAEPGACLLHLRTQQP